MTSMEKKHNTSGKVKSILIASTLAIGFAAQPAQAALSFSFNYLSPGQGFDDPTFGAARKTALNQAADLLGAYFSNYTANLTYDVVSFSNGNTNTLASASSPMFVEPGTFQQTAVQTKILSNGATDITGANADGNIDWNFSQNWGLGDSVSNSEFDFKTVAIHELLHSFGFSSNNSSANGSGLDGELPGTPDTWSIFDQFLTDAAGETLVSSAGIFDANKLTALTGGSGSVLFNGANAKAANGGLGVNIYAPNPYQDGSSISHLDDDTTAFSQMIMTASVSTGLKTRELSAIEIGILKDIGYTQIAAVPVPGAVWFMLTGVLGMLGFNRRKVAA